VFRLRGAIVKSLGLKKGQVVADVGAGTGIFLSPLQQAIGARGKLIAVELSPNFVRFLRNKAKKAKIPYKVVRSTFTSTRLKNNSVDVIFTCDTYHHFDKPVAMLKDFRRALRKKGRLVIVDFDRIPGKSRRWIMNHIKHGKKFVLQQIVANGFKLVKDIPLKGLKENYVLLFEKK
jgi:ubiquinone/menaquinone biosynthesis C-methylase UbiE